jgi:hypothetical protein
MEGETICCWMGALGWPSSPSRLLLLLALAAMPAKKKQNRNSSKNKTKGIGDNWWRNTQ